MWPAAGSTFRGPPSWGRAARSVGFPALSLQGATCQSPVLSALRAARGGHTRLAHPDGPRSPHGRGDTAATPWSAARPAGGSSSAKTAAAKSEVDMGWEDPGEKRRGGRCSDSGPRTHRPDRASTRCGRLSFQAGLRPCAWRSRGRGAGTPRGAGAGQPGRTRLWLLTPLWTVSVTYMPRSQFLKMRALLQGFPSGRGNGGTALDCAAMNPSAFPTVRHRAPGLTVSSSCDRVPLTLPVGPAGEDQPEAVGGH